MYDFFFKAAAYNMLVCLKRCVLDDNLSKFERSVVSLI